MKVCLVPVCFNAYDDAFRFLESIDHAFNNCSNLTLNIIFADNSTISPNIDISRRECAYSFHYMKNDNVGYFPAFNKALCNLSEGIDNYDYVIVCNVDLVVAEDFFSSLLINQPSDQIGLLAPGIFSDKDGRNLNPKMMHRPSKRKIEMMHLICSSVMLFFWYGKLASVRQQVRAWRQQWNRRIPTSTTHMQECEMYGAHGSFMIFTRSYFAQGAHVFYPRFLFGEEVFVAEQLRMHGLKIKNAPNIQIFDKEHASTSRVKLNFICSEHKKSYDYLKEHFFS
ncbi:glycosyl transferase [Pollutimonas harenae]|nr:glycosyl transferase [Pollutimonas harenae]